MDWSTSHKNSRLPRAAEEIIEKADCPRHPEKGLLPGFTNSPRKLRGIRRAS